MIWLGTFVTAEDASKNYESKKLEFEELVMAKSAKNGQISEKSDQESSVTDEFEEKSSMSVDENTNTSNGVEESDEELMMGTWVKILENQEVKYSHKLGVPIVDNYGFLLGEFSILDDLRIYMWYCQQLKKNCLEKKYCNYRRIQALYDLLLVYVLL